MRTLLAEGLRKAAEGVTTLAEVSREVLIPGEEF
jgi:type II secretory ATPase GspE/PulE/Tfp pilus assembly ATPase PilB-like protein